MQDVVRKYVLENNLKNAVILVAYSGGVDSTALLHICAALNLKPVAIHLNHGWRGAESNAEETLARNFCKKLGAEFYSERLSSDVKQTETGARKARYAFFERCVEKFNADAVFLAHNKNDNIETLLYRLIKGTGVEGLCAIPRRRGKYHRPLLDVMRCEIEEYVAKNALPAAEDSSNKNIKYARNFIRAEILPKMAELNENVYDAIGNLINIANAQNRINEEVLGSFDDSIESAKFLKFSEDMQMLFLHRFLKDDLKNLTYEKISEVRDFILENSSASAAKRYSLNAGLFLEAGSRCISKTLASVPKIEYELPVNTCGEYVFEPLGLKFIMEKVDKMPKTFPKENEPVAYVNFDSLEGLVLRTRREGDVLRPFGMQGTMKLKEFLINRKISRQKRDTLLLLCKQNEILWVPALCVSEKLRAERTPLYRLRIEVIC